MQNISKDELKGIIDEAVSRGVKETLESLGFDMQNPTDIQRNMLYLDDQRRTSEQVGTWTRRMVWGALVSGMIGVLGVGLIAGVKQALGIH